HFYVNTTADTHDAVPGDGKCLDTEGKGECSLRAAIEEANLIGDHVVIHVSGGPYELTLGELVHVNTDTRIVGRGVVVDAGHRSRILENRGTLFILDVTFQNGDATAEADHDGGAILNLGSLGLRANTFLGNTAERGGAISNEGDLTDFGDI